MSFLLLLIFLKNHLSDCAEIIWGIMGCFFKGRPQGHKKIPSFWDTLTIIWLRVQGKRFSGSTVIYFPRNGDLAALFGGLGAV